MNQRRLSITSALIISNIAVFVLGALLPTLPVVYGVPLPRGDYNESVLVVRGAFSWYSCFTEGELWRLFSYQFLHGSTMHLLFNMWALYFFGPMVEEAMGQGRYLLFYLSCGVAGALFYSLLGMVGFFPSAADPATFARLQYLSAYTGIPGLEQWQLVPLVGASAAIYGLLIAVAYMYPTLRIRLIFPPIDMTLRNFALVVLAIAVATVLLNGHNAGGEAGHLGGIILAAIIMSIWKWRYLRRRKDDGIF